MNSKSDIEVIEGVLTGNIAYFEELLSRYAHKVHNLALRITRNQEDAEEILQDVFVTVHSKLRHFEGKSAFSSWLYRIAVNTAFMKLRKRRQQFTVSMEDVSPTVSEGWTGERSDSSDVNYLSARHELRAELEQAIAKLPEEYRMIFVLRDVDGLSNQEVGEVLHLSVPAVKSRLHRSRLMLRKRLQKFYNDYRNDDEIAYGPAGESCEVRVYN